MDDNNIVFIGKEPLRNYIVAVLTTFHENNQIIIRARGQAISRAVDVAEIVRHRHVKDAMIDDIRIGTENLPSKDGPNVNVSYIEIRMSKPPDSPSPLRPSGPHAPTR